MEDGVYGGFCLDTVQHITNHLADIGEEVKVTFYADGYVADSEEAERFIRQTNEKYGNQDAEVLVGDFILVSDEKNGLETYNCRFEVAYLWEEYLRSGWDRIDTIVDNNLRAAKKVDRSVFSTISDYAAVKDKLILCLRNISRNKFRHRDSLFQKFDDMAMVLYVIVGDDGKGTRLIAPVARKMTLSWGMNDDDILAAALMNTARLTPPRILVLGLGMKGLCVEDEWDFMDPLSPLHKITSNPLGVLVTATPRTDGSVAVFYPGVLERLSEMAEGDFYVVFSGRDEAHIHLPNTVTLKKVRNVLLDTNRAFPEDMLTNNVYYYNSKQKALKKV